MLCLSNPQDDDSRSYPHVDTDGHSPGLIGTGLRVLGTSSVLLQYLGQYLNLVRQARQGIGLWWCRMPAIAAFRTGVCRFMDPRPEYCVYDHAKMPRTCSDLRDAALCYRL